MDDCCWNTDDFSENHSEIFVDRERDLRDLKGNRTTEQDGHDFLPHELCPNRPKHGQDDKIYLYITKTKHWQEDKRPAWLKKNAPKKRSAKKICVDESTCVDENT